jgi:hypothetical protein
MQRIYRLQLCHHILAITFLIPSNHETQLDSKVTMLYLFLPNSSLFFLDFCVLFHPYANTCFLATLPHFLIFRCTRCSWRTRRNVMRATRLSASTQRTLVRKFSSIRLNMWCSTSTARAFLCLLRFAV